MKGVRDGYLNCLVVLTEYRRRNIGSQLLNTALKRFKEMGCNHVFGVVNDGNNQTLGFLEKNSFAIGGKFRYVEKML